MIPTAMWRFGIWFSCNLIGHKLTPNTQENMTKHCLRRVASFAMEPEARGRFEATGIRPTFMHKLEAAGVRLPSSAFRQRVMLAD